MKYIITIKEDLSTPDDKYNDREIYKQTIESDTTIVPSIMEVILKNQSHIQYPPIYIETPLSNEIKEQMKAGKL
jgi:hypothetical protein